MATVKIECTTEDAVVRYTTDNSEPTEESTLYESPFSINGVTVKAKGFKEGWTPSDTASADVPDKVPTPVLNLSRKGATVTGTISNTINNASYVYKRSSTPPSSETDGTVISGASFSFNDSTPCTVSVRGFAEGYEPSEVASDSISAQPSCATPSISQSGNTVTFTCSTSGATIHYSGCGKSGMCSSGDSISITQSGTMSAYATASYYKTSGTAQKICNYTAPTPTFPSFTVHYDSDAVYNGTTMPKWYVVCSNKPSGAEFVLHYSSSSSTLNLTDLNGNPCLYSRLISTSSFKNVVGSASGYLDRTVSTYTRD